MLHRDVARGNILHTLPSKGRVRGVLIDLEEAIPYEESKSEDIEYTTVRAQLYASKLFDGLANNL